MGFTICALFIGVQNSRYRPEHLQYKRLTVHQIELFDSVLDCGGYQFIGLVKRIDLQERWHYHEISK